MSVALRNGAVIAVGTLPPDFALMLGLPADPHGIAVCVDRSGAAMVLAGGVAAAEALKERVGVRAAPGAELLERSTVEFLRVPVPMTQLAPGDWPHRRLGTPDEWLGHAPGDGASAWERTAVPFLGDPQVADAPPEIRAGFGLPQGELAMVWGTTPSGERVTFICTPETAEALRAAKDDGGGAIDISPDLLLAQRSGWPTDW